MNLKETIGFLLCCIRNSDEGVVDFDEVRKELNLRNKRAASDRYRYLLRKKSTIQGAMSNAASHITPKLVSEQVLARGGVCESCAKSLNVTIKKEPKEESDEDEYYDAQEEMDEDDDEEDHDVKEEMEDHEMGTEGIGQAMDHLLVEDHT